MRNEHRARSIGRLVFGLLFILAGIGHFAVPDVYLKIMPPYLPSHRLLVLLSGFFEILLGVLLLVPWASRLAAWGLIALLIAVFPANIYLYQHQEIFPLPPILHLLRLPIQGLLILWAFAHTRRDVASADDALSGMIPRHPSPSPGMPETPIRPRRRLALRVTLGGLMLTIVGLAACMGWWTNKVRRQKRAVDAIIARGGQILFAHQRAPTAANPNAINASARPPGPEWLRRRIGDDYFVTAVAASINRLEYRPNTARSQRKPIPPLKPHDDDIMAAFADLPDLETVNLDRGPTTDAGLSHLAGLKHLRALTLGEADDITDAGLAHLAGLTKLDRLVIFHAGKITDAGVAHLAEMKSLTNLWIAGDHLTDEALKTIGGLPALEDLLLRTEYEPSVDPLLRRDVRGKIGDVGLGYLAGLGRMKTLALPTTAAGTAGFAALAKLESLETLDIETGPLSAGTLAPLRDLPKLRSLTIASPTIDDAALECLATFPKLELFQVRCPKLSPANLDCIAKAGRLTYLTLDCPNLTDDLLAHVGSMKRLDVLQLVNVEEVTDSGIENLRGLDALVHLAVMSRPMQRVFAKCQITDRGLSSAATFPKIRMVRIYSPRITKAGLDRVKKDHPEVSFVSPAGNSRRSATNPAPPQEAP